MANICFVKHVFMLEDATPSEAAKTQFERLKDLLNRHQTCHDDGYSSLYHMFKELELNPDGVSLRSYGFDVMSNIPVDVQIPDIAMESEFFLFVEESTAWKNQTVAWEKIMEIFPDVSHFWYASEPHNLYFEKGDMDGTPIFPSTALVFDNDDDPTCMERIVVEARNEQEAGETFKSMYPDKDIDALIQDESLSVFNL